jgi:predicted transcriptional regulator
MSIHPEFAKLILSGRKRVEFRKRRFAEPVTHVVIYATVPVARIVGVFEVDAVEEAPPQRLWRRYGRVAGIAHTGFSVYYTNYRVGVAIRVGRVFPLTKPRRLSGLSRSLTPPRTFRYLQDGVIERILDDAGVTRNGRGSD